MANEPFVYMGAVPWSRAGSYDSRSASRDRSSLHITTWVWIPRCVPHSDGLEDFSKEVHIRKIRRKIRGRLIILLLLSSYVKPIFALLGVLNIDCVTCFATMDNSEIIDGRRHGPLASQNQRSRLPRVSLSQSHLMDARG